jgi:hypothetical protein
MSLDKANLSVRDKALYAKLHVSQRDISIARSCAAFLRKKGWHTHAFFRRGTIPIQQVSFTTTMIVAYARPFSPGRGGFNFATRLLQYQPPEVILHDRLLALRHEAYAHSDAKRHNVIPLKGDRIRSIASGIIDVWFTPTEIDIFLGMTAGLMTRIDKRMEQLRKGELDTNASA